MPRIKKLLQTGRAEPGTPTIDWEQGVLTVTFLSGRKQAVRYRCDEQQVHLTSTVLGSTRARNHGLESLARTVLHRNRHSELAGFRLGPDDRLDAWCSVPLATLSPAEARFVISTVACEADAFQAELIREDAD